MEKNSSARRVSSEDDVILASKGGVYTQVHASRLAQKASGAISHDVPAYVIDVKQRWTENNNSGGGVQQ